MNFHPEPAAAFVAFIGAGALFALGAWLAFKLIDVVDAWFARTEELDLTELDRYDALREAMTRHPAKGEQS